MAKIITKTTIISFFVLFAFVPYLITHAEQINPPVIYDGGGNLRACPSFDCRVVRYGAMIPRVEILESSGDWYKVNLIERGYFDYNKNKAVELPNSQWETHTGWMYYSVFPENILAKLGRDSLNKKDEVLGTGVLKEQSTVRGCPSTNYCVILTYLNAGDKVQIVGIDGTGEWYKVNFDNSLLEGWDKWINASNFTDESRSLISGSLGKVSTPTATSTQQKPFFSFPAFGNWIKAVVDRFGSGFTKGFLTALALLVILVVFYLIRKYRLISKVDFSRLKHYRTVGVLLSLTCVVAVYFFVSNYYQKREDELKGFLTTQQKTLEETQKSIEALGEKQEEESQQRIAQERAAKEIIQKLETKVASASANKTSDFTSVVNQWSSIIAKIECEFVYNREPFTSLGSGTALGLNGQVVILSNKHVLVPENIMPSICRAKLSSSVSTYSSDDIRVAASGADWAVLYLTNIDSQIRSITALQPAFCQRKPSVGDEVVVLGYPSIGSKTTITATEGIIAGYDGNFFITSAKVEQGNSGGAAILIKDNCLLGIPTFAQVGQVESLARILDISTVLK